MSDGLRYKDSNVTNCYRTGLSSVENGLRLPSQEDLISFAFWSCYGKTNQSEVC